MTPEYWTKITREGITVWSDCIRADSTGIVFGSLFGPHNAVRALWADIVLRTTSDACTTEGFKVGGTTDKGTWYLSTSSVIERGLLHLILARVEATTQVPVGVARFYSVGPQPSIDWWPIFKRLMPVPVRDAWRDFLWEEGRREGNSLIQKLGGVGHPGYSIKVSRNSWLEVIKDGFTKGMIS